MNDTLPASPNRRRILLHIQANPGSCLQEVADKLGLTRTALTHHVRVLSRDGLVGSSRNGRRVMLFPRGITHSAERSVLGLLRQASARAILEALYHDPRRSFRQLANQLEMTPHTVRWHVGRLQQQGLIHVMRSGLGKSHTIHFHPTVRESLGPQLTAREHEAPLASMAGTAPMESQGVELMR